MKPIVAALTTMLARTGCASTHDGWTPAVDLNGRSEARHAEDLKAYRAVADEHGPDPSQAGQRRATKRGLGTAAALGALTMATGGAAAVAAPVTAALQRARRSRGRIHRPGHRHRRLRAASRRMP